MPRKKKQEIAEENKVENKTIEEQVVMLQQQEDVSPVTLRLQLLSLSKEIL